MYIIYEYKPRGAFDENVNFEDNVTTDDSNMKAQFPHG